MSLHSPEAVSKAPRVAWCIGYIIYLHVRSRKRRVTRSDVVGVLAAWRATEPRVSAPCCQALSTVPKQLLGTYEGCVVCGKSSCFTSNLSLSTRLLKRLASSACSLCLREACSHDAGALPVLKTAATKYWKSGCTHGVCVKQRVFRNLQHSPLCLGWCQVLKKAGKRALGGGIPGAAAMAIQVLSLMW